MSRRRVAALALVLLTALTAGAGCSKGGATGGDKVKARTWAKQICGTVRPWAEHIQQSVTDAQATLGNTSEPAVAKPKLSRLFGDAATETDNAIKGVDRAGVPDVKDGQAVAKQFRAALVSARDAFAKAKRSVDQLDTSDKATFNAAVVRIGTQLSADYGSAGKKIDTSKSDELKKAFDTEPACTKAG